MPRTNRPRAKAQHERRSINGHLHYRQQKGKCSTGKLRYPTEIDAAIALGRAQSGRPVKGRDAKVETRHYYCPECRGHHLTSAPNRTSS